MGQLFRESGLPNDGVRLYLQIIETAFGADFDTVVPNWYHKHFTYEERHTWAVVARHFYTAWQPQCMGSIFPQGQGNQCDADLESIRARIKACITPYAEDFAWKFDGLRSVTEWSLG